MSDSEKRGILDNYSDVLTAVDLMSILHTGRTLTYKMLNNCLLYTSPSPRD